MSLARWFDDPFGSNRYGLRDYDHHPQWLDLDRRIPYWLNRSLMSADHLGNTLGEVQNDNEKFAVKVECSHFRPEELTVNVKGNELVIEGHHEEKTDHNGRIERHFIRKFAMPKDANEQGLACHLSQDGQLTVAAPKKALEGAQSRRIPIQPAPAGGNQTKQLKN